MIIVNDAEHVRLSSLYKAVEARTHSLQDVKDLWGTRSTKGFKNTMRDRKVDLVFSFTDLGAMSHRIQVFDQPRGEHPVRLTYPGQDDVASALGCDLTISKLVEYSQVPWIGRTFS